jgi:CHAD domain-containing protein
VAGFRFGPGETLAHAVRRVAREQLSAALDHLVAAEGKRDKRVHEARKCMKRLRGLVRLIRHDMGEESYLRENATFRDAAGLMSGLRDAAVRVQTMDKLIEHCGANVPRSRFSPVTRWLRQRRRSAYARVATDDRAVQQVVRELERSHARVSAWPLSEDDWRGVDAGLKRIYDRGRRECREVYRDPSDERFHDWRKSVKYLWYHSQLLNARNPTPFDVITAELDHLGELLGDDHDLVLLEHTLSEEYPKGRSPSTTRALRTRILQKRGQLQQAARALGSRVYLEKAGAFEARLQGTWPGLDQEHAV